MPARIASSEPRWLTRGLPWVLGALLHGIIPATARADEPEAHRAIELGRRALDAYSRGSFEVAREEFAAAEQIAHSPVFVLYLARCERALGRLLRARELYLSVTAEKLPADAPAPWQLALTDARTELGALRQEIPSFLLESQALAAVSKAALNERTIDLSGDEIELEVDPGIHVLEVTYRDGTAERLALRAIAGKRRERVELARMPRLPATVAPVSPPAGAPFHAPLRLDARPASSLRTWSYVAWGASAVSLGVGMVSGIVALRTIDDVKGRCENSICGPEEAGNVERASDWATVSTLSFIAAGGFLTVGTTAFLVSADTKKDEVEFIARGSF